MTRSGATSWPHMTRGVGCYKPAEKAGPREGGLSLGGRSSLTMRKLAICHYKEWVSQNCHSKE
jgi:hypothetical protein